MSVPEFRKVFIPGLIVSSQASKGEPLYDAKILTALAKSAELGGAKGFRVNGPEVTAELRAATSLPILSIYKKQVSWGVLITPGLDEAAALARAGASCIALDATKRPRPGGTTAADLIRRIHDELGLPVMADIATFEEGLAAAEAGADAVATTLSGYTDYTKKTEGPDLDLVRRLAAAVDVPVVAEGRYNTPELAARAIQAGAYAVVVGTAITRPHVVAGWFNAAVQEALGQKG